jgi:hypothetical protein
MSKEIRESEIIEDEQTFAFSEDHKNEIGSLRKQLDEAEEVIKFYENCKRLMLEVRDVANEDAFGMPLFIESTSITDNGDAARAYLNKYSDKRGE